MRGQEAIEISIFDRLFSAVAEEMGIVLRKSAFSANIKERRDFSCAICDGRGRLVAQAAHIPVHLGAMPATMAALLKEVDFVPEDLIITNDPYAGGTHLPDITLIKPVFADADRPLFFLLVRAHHADVGGKMPGSMPLASHISEEGVLIRPQHLKRQGRINEEFLAWFLSQVRNPQERRGDLTAQQAALVRGEIRLKEMIRAYGIKTLIERVEGLFLHAQQMMEETISEIPDGHYFFEDCLDDDGLGKEPVKIVARVSIDGSRAIVDLSDSDKAASTGINTVASVAAAAVYYVFLALSPEEMPINAGALEPIRVLTKPGTVVDARYPSPVAAGNVETSQRLVDVILGALAQAIPERIPAASCGSMNNVAMGFGELTYYETIGGGMGGRFGAPGLSGVHTHMTNTLNTPIEALEQIYPLLVERYRLRERSGGRGRFRGGDGIIRAYRFLQPTQVTILSERRRFCPYGLQGGAPGRRGQNVFIRGGKKRILPGKTHLQALPGDILEIRTPGGGGWGA
ncbi:hydantoinase B/oxoprolinase family protein [Thermosulfuriphilus ammonigenes]|uniref:Hydantoinase B/oxoprolinase family protein n=1 Tax=Thermosulfuriphilus ammonigenes TaxID=1936021 RepID=A0A6G7PVC8_9BACT|nr:hydantoinase B/oxoprolinase family protein [Thermosulfuriphilus ammonigenes]MBA2848372.1 N-methylhydantoinase B [Thermosulfuriphilus ammonigenes]QIJ71471.1 hydantoinase B/oxoprolinase family protein [Thermosulfuriphilus ammonigenes]